MRSICVTSKTFPIWPEIQDPFLASLAQAKCPSTSVGVLPVCKDSRIRPTINSFVKYMLYELCCVSHCSVLYEPLALFQQSMYVTLGICLNALLNGNHLQPYLCFQTHLMWNNHSCWSDSPWPLPGLGGDKKQRASPFLFPLPTFVWHSIGPGIIAVLGNWSRGTVLSLVHPVLCVHPLPEELAGHKKGCKLSPEQQQCVLGPAH